MIEHINNKLFRVFKGRCIYSTLLPKFSNFSRSDNGFYF